MKRRRYLALTTLALAGCSGNETNQQASSTTTKSTTTEASTTKSTTTTTTTEETTTTTTAAPAEFELVSVNAPKEVEIGQKTSYSFTVKNVGEQSGIFETTISTKTATNNWDTSEPWTVTLNPGETKTLESQSFTSPYLVSYTIRIDAFDHTFPITFVSAQQSYGEPYNYQDKVKFNIRGFAFNDSYTWSSGDYDYTQTPDEGKKYVEVQAWAKNIGNSAEYLPTRYNISLIAGNSQYGAITDYRKDGVYQGGEVQPEIVRQGRILYQVPENISSDQVKIVWSPTSYTGDVSVYWSQNPDN